MPYDIDTEWKKAPKPDNALAQDGEYYAIAGQTVTKTSRDGQTEWLEVPVTVSQGEFAEEKVFINYFYQRKGEINEIGMDSLKKLCDKVDKRIRETADSFLGSLDLLGNVLNGRKIKFKQVTKDAYVNHYITEVYEADTPF